MKTYSEKEINYIIRKCAERESKRNPGSMKVSVIELLRELRRIKKEIKND